MIIVNTEASNYSVEAADLYAKLGTYIECTIESFLSSELHLSVSVLVSRFGLSTKHLRNKDLPNLKYWVVPATCAHNVDENFVKERGIKLISFMEHTDLLSNVYSTSEHALMLTLILLRGGFEHQAKLDRGIYDRHNPRCRELYGKSVLIIGYGRVGRQLHRLLSAFKCNIFIYDKRAETRLTSNALFVDIFNDPISGVDVVYNLITSSVGNTGFIDETILQRLSLSAQLINLARSLTVHEPSLIRWLEASEGRGYATDSIRDDDSTGYRARFLELRKAQPERFVITPHLGGTARESFHKAELAAAKLLLMSVQKKSVL